MDFQQPEVEDRQHGIWEKTSKFEIVRMFQNDRANVMFRQDII